MYHFLQLGKSEEQARLSALASYIFGSAATDGAVLGLLAHVIDTEQLQSL